MRHGWSASRSLVAGRRLLAVILFLVIGWALPGQAQTSTAAQWRPWEQVITSKKDYYLSGNGNPYKDVVLTVTYTNASSGKAFKRYGFWEGGKTFKIRGAFPPGTWNWSTTCSSTVGTTDCSSGETATSATDTGLLRSGTVTASSLLIADHPAADLWNRGFLQVSADNRYLLYGDGTTPFFWMADTAWTASSLATAVDWSSYLSDRYTKKFTVVLLGLAPIYSWVTPAPVAFEQVTGCSSSDPIPNRCSRWKPSYWQGLDSKVQTANAWGQVVMLTGLNDPYDQGTKSNPGQYPWGSDAVVFARNLAARMAGYFVIYSPAFDDSKDAIHGGETQETVMKAVAGALVPTQPANPETRTRQLVTMHLAGGSQYTDYSAFQGNVNLHVFHSGHAFNSGNCQTGETQVQCALRRAREMPLALGNYSGTGFSPLRPITNGEALYDAAYPVGSEVEPDTPSRVRQAGYLTTLSGAFGYTLGVGRLAQNDIVGIFPWVFPLANMTPYLNTKSAEQMGYLRTVFYNRPWKDLRPQHCNPPTASCGNLIPNQGTAADQKRVVAVTTNWRYAIAYVPGKMDLQLDCGGFPGFATTRWSKQWLDPRTGTTTGATATLVSGTVFKFDNPAQVPDACIDPNSQLGKCDWVLLLEDTCPTCLSSSATSFSEASLQVWQGHDEGSVAPGILAQAVKAGGQPLNREILATAGMPGAHKLPQVARERSGTSLVVWQSDGLDGSLWGIWARRFNPTGEPLGDAFQVNTYTDHDQSDPAVASTVGDFVVAWTSYGQDGDRGGIFAQRVGASGRLVGEEIAVNTQSEGYQGFPQVGADASGNFAIAWESQKGDQRSIYFQRFDRQGMRLGREELVVSSSEGLRELVSLAVDPLGELTIQWQSYDGEGGNLGRYQRRFHSDGSPSGEAALVAWSGGL